MGTALLRRRRQGQPPGAELVAARRRARVLAPARPRSRSRTSSSTSRWTGIEWSAARDAFIDEIPGAYKDIDVVMQDAADLVEVRHTLRQIVNVKGD